MHARLKNIALLAACVCASALAAIDTPLRRLRISVRFDDASQASRRGLEASGALRSGDAWRMTESRRLWVKVEEIRP